MQGIMERIHCIVVQKFGCIVGRNKKYLSLSRLGLLPCLLASGSGVSNIKDFYYIDTSVLLENIPLVKFIKTSSGS